MYGITAVPIGSINAINNVYLNIFPKGSRVKQASPIARPITYLTEKNF